MKSRINLFLANALIVTLTIIFSTCLFLAQIRDDALQLAKQEQEEAIRTFWQLLRVKGSDYRIIDGRLMAGDYVINGNYELPDTIREIFGGTATVFMGDTRVSTNVRKSDGARAVGTKLTGPAFDAIFKGNLPYRGEAPILGTPYFTAYDPIRNRKGETIGVLYVGVKKSEFLTAYSRLKFNVIAGSVVIEILFIALGFVLLWERNRYEELLRESEQKYHTLFTKMLNGFALHEVICDESGKPVDYRFLEINDAFEAQTGLKRETLIDRTVREVFPAIEEEWIERYGAVALTGHPDHFENFTAGLDRWFEVSAYSPKPKQFAVTFADITERVQAEVRIREVARVLSETTGENFFPSLVENLSLLLQTEYAFIGVLAGDQGETVRVIASFAHGKPAETFEYTLAGTPCAEVVKGSFCFYPDGVARRYPGNRLLTDMNAEGFLGAPLKLADGRVVGVMAVLDSKAIVKRHDTEPIFRLFTVRAATELSRRKKENRLREMADSLQNQLGFLQTLIDTIPSPIFYKDREGRYLGCNLAFGNCLGLEREQLVGKTVHYLAPPDLANTYHAMDDALFTKPGVQVYESSLLYADGTRHDVIFNKATFTDKDGQVAGLVGVILDVTDRKKAEDMLAEREEFLSNILDSMQDGISILDEELRIIRVNPVMERWLSDRGPLVGRKCHEAYNRLTEPCEICPALETLRTGKPALKIYSKLINGSEVWLELYTYPLFDPQKSRITGVIENIRDVTEQKRAEGALVFAEKKFRSLVEQSLVGTYIIQDGRFVYVNPKMAEIFGYTQDELTSGISHLDLTMEEDRPLAAENVRRRTDEEVQSVHYGFRGLRKDGTTINAEVYGTVTQYNSRPAIIGTLLDVTARKRAETALRESEERFHQIFAQSFDAIILFRIDNLSIIDANPRAEELTGFTRSELKRFTLTSILAQEDFRRLMNSEPLDDHTRGFHLEKGVCTRKDGSTTYVSIWSKIIMLRDRSVVYCSIRDITEKTRLEEEIRTTQAKLIHANKMTSLGMLASSIAHEINNPNNYIAVNASMLADVWQDAAPVLRRHREEHGDFPVGGLPCSEMEELAPRLFTGIAEGSRRINAIVTNMKDYVKPDERGQPVEFDVNRTVQDAATILWHHIHKYSDNFMLSLEENLPPARGSRQQIEQVVINLISNALQALPDRSAAVSVATSFDRPAGFIQVTIKDDGKGMSRKVLQRLSEPFFTTRSKEGGTGLGLYIAASIIKEHGGALEFDSKPGRGTTATIRLPAA